MKIAFITNLFPPHYIGGFEIRCGQVARALQGRGHHVCVLTSWHGIVEPRVDRDEIAVHRILDLYLPFTNPATGETYKHQLQRGDRWKTTIANYQLARVFLLAEEPDIVFAWSQSRLSLGAVRAASDLRIPIAWTFGDPNIAQYKPASPRHPIPFLKDHTIWRRATWSGLDFSHSHCVSLDIKKRLLARGLPVQSAQVIYRGIPVEQFPLRENPGGKHSPTRVLFVGQLHKFKGVHTLIEAAHQLTAKHGAGYLSLTIVGEGVDEYKKQLSTMAEGGPTVVTFVGKLPHDELSPLYRQHDVFVFPSAGGGYEGFGATALEAMASGLPIVGTTAGGMAELFEHEKNALVFAPENADDLAEKLERIITDGELRTRLAHAGRAQVERDFALAAYAEKMEQFLVQAATKQGGK